MKKIILSITICLFAIHSFAQITILPSDKIIDKSLIKSRKTTMDYSMHINGKITLLGKYEVGVNYNNKILEVFSKLEEKNKSFPTIKHLVSDANSLKPISCNLLNLNSKLELQFSDKISGFLHERNSDKITINEKMKDGYFDINTYPYILPALPLTEGFRAKIPVYNYNANSDAEKFSNVTIIRVKSDVHYATYTGNHNVWFVIVLDNSTKKTTSYFIDKETREFWKILYSDDEGNIITYTNNESDYNPLKNKFDKNATLNLITKGKSIIKGQAFAKDYQPILPGINLAKKQFARKGTKIILTPYTPYFEEWNKANEPKKNSLYTPPKLPLPEDAELCMIQTTVTDDEGSFEFKNLMPGKYLVTTAFNFNHVASETTVIGKYEYFTNGYYLGSSDITKTEHYDMRMDANIKKLVEVTKDGEIVIVKLKKSL